MVEQNKKLRILEDVLLVCFLLCAAFDLFNHNFQSTEKKKRLVNHHEYVSYSSAVPTGKNEVKIFNPLPFSFSEFNETSAQPKKNQGLTVKEKNFLRVKILLKLNSYN